MMWGYNWGIGWGWMLVGSLMMIAFWVGLIWILYLAVRGTTRGGDHGEDPRKIAARRLASGEISHDEYDRINNEAALLTQAWREIPPPAEPIA